MRTDICHLSSGHSVNDVRVYHKECASLVGSGYVVTLIAQDGDVKQDDKLCLIKVKNPRNRWIRFIVTTYLVYKKGINVDALFYHVHDPELLPYAYALKRRGKRVIYDAHEDLPRQILSKEWVPKIIRSLVSRIFEVFEDYIVKKLDVVVCATDKISERFQRIHKRVITIHNYPTLKLLDATNGSEMRPNNAVCYIGGISYLRGIKEMLAVVQRAGIEMHIAGCFDVYDLEVEARKMPGWSYVKYHGYVNRDVVQNIMKTTRAGLVVFHTAPNHTDAMPNKLFEYMAVGLPVIASNFPAWKAIIERHKCGICVDPLEVDQMVGAILWIMANPTEAQDMGRRGREAVQKYYNWEYEGEKLTDMYRALSTQMSCAVDGGRS